VFAPHAAVRRHSNDSETMSEKQSRERGCSVRSLHQAMQ
jgi:hypothetical protein